MANVTVTFDRIDVGSDGDPGITDGGGDFFWKLSVNGSAVSQRTESNPLVVRNGGVIDLNRSRSIELRPQEVLTVSGYLNDRDQGTSGADETDSFEHEYDQSQNWGDGTHQVPLNDRDMACTLHYSVTAD
jgi:hypothetical protein